MPMKFVSIQRIRAGSGAAKKPRLWAALLLVLCTSPIRIVGGTTESVTMGVPEAEDGGAADPRDKAANANSLVMMGVPEAEMQRWPGSKLAFLCLSQKKMTTSMPR